METLLFWALPVILVLSGLKGKLMVAWRLCFASMVAVYIGVWGAPAWWGLLDFLPSEVVPYRNALAMLVSVAALFAILYKSATAIAPASHDEIFVFPKAAERVLNVFFRFVFGIAVSTLLFVFCSATPLKMMIRNNGEGMQARGGAALLRLTAFGDRITFCTPESPRKEMLDKLDLWYVPPPPPPDPKDKKKFPGRSPDQLKMPTATTTNAPNATGR